MIAASLVPVLQSMKTRNDRMECVKTKAHTVIRPSHTPRWFISTPPIRMVIQLTNNQLENPMAQTADSQPPQTLHVELEQTTSAWLRKLPTQLNTPNRFVPDLVLVSPNVSDVQRLGRSVPAFTRPKLAGHVICWDVYWNFDWSFMGLNHVWWHSRTSFSLSPLGLWHLKE